MHIVRHAHLATVHDAGERQIAAADTSLGVRAFEVWMRRLDPGAQTREMRHEGELVVLVLAGCGKLLIDGGPQRFHAPCTVIVPAGCGFRFANDGSEPMQMIAVFTRRPVATEGRDRDDGAGDDPGDDPGANLGVRPSWPAGSAGDGSFGR